MPQELWKTFTDIVSTRLADSVSSVKSGWLVRFFGNSVSEIATELNRDKLRFDFG